MQADGLRSLRGSRTDTAIVQPLNKEIVEYFAKNERITEFASAELRNRTNLLLSVVERYEELGILAMVAVQMAVYFSELARTLRSPATISPGLALDVNYAAIAFFLWTYSLLWTTNLHRR